MNPVLQKTEALLSLVHRPLSIVHSAVHPCPLLSIPVPVHCPFFHSRMITVTMVMVAVASTMQMILFTTASVAAFPTDSAVRPQ
jgi:hypothetical protein